MIDTGAATTVGHTPTFEFGGMTFPCVPNYYGFTTEGLTDFIGHQIDYLVGLEVLQHFPFKIDMGRKEITFFPKGYEFPDGFVVPLKRGIGGLLLTFPFKLNGRPVEGVFDTGAPISYMPQPQGQPDGTADDFFPGYGRWTTALYRNQVEFGDRKLEMKFGVLPAACILSFVTPWLVGGEFLKSGPIGFDIARMRLHLFSNDNRQGCSESRSSANPPTGGDEQQDPAQIQLARPDRGEI